jgi:hypothetical protein
MTGSSRRGARGGARIAAPRTWALVGNAVRAPSWSWPTRPGPGSAPAAGRYASRSAATVSRQGGSATVELAAVIPLLVVVTLAMIGLVGIARDQVLAQGAAREGAREAALGGDRARAVSAARAALPSDRPARVSIAPAGIGRVRVEVELPVRLPFGVPMVTVRAAAVAVEELGPPPSPAGP